MSVARKQAGFTLIELMVIVTIIGVLTAAAGPGFSSAIADQRAVKGTRATLRLGRTAYWETVGKHRAHLLWMTDMDGSNGGRVELIRGDTNSCNQKWTQLRAVADCGAVGSRCIDWLDLDAAYSSGSRGPRLREAGGTSNLAVCYQPDGSVQHGTSLAGPFITGNLDSGGQNLGGGFRFTVQSYNNGSAEGVVRRLVFPLGGMPRSQR